MLGFQASERPSVSLSSKQRPDFDDQHRFQPPEYAASARHSIWSTGSFGIVFPGKSSTWPYAELDSTVSSTPEPASSTVEQSMLQTDSGVEVEMAPDVPR